MINCDQIVSRQNINHNNPESELNTKAAHQALLDNIERCLPANYQPNILSDAIFKTPWVKAIEDKN
jgi:hypothetical protein